MDPLLSSLCTICYIDPPKYTCPRCSAQTCSLPCSKRHKVRASCNGVRDPTVFKPMSELATPSGIDHDYNFLHSIETRIQRTEKVLIEDLGIVSRGELKRARDGGRDEDFKRRVGEPRGEVQISRVLQAHNIKVAKAPTGMRRNQENTTNWAKNSRDIKWQVEWVREAPLGRTLYQAKGNTPIGDTYDRLCEEERRMEMTPEERKLEKKRNAEARTRDAKRVKLDLEGVDSTIVSSTQEPQTTTSEALQDSTPNNDLEETPLPEPKERKYNLYLLRPGTPASFPKVLTPVDSSTPLTELLRNRTVLEFPTIHVLTNQPENLPKTFMLEKAFLAATGHPGTDTETSSSDEDSEVSDDTSSDGDSAEEESEAEDGEIVG